MYNTNAISTLTDRVGWDEFQQPSDLTLSEENGKHNCGRFFSSFHTLVIPENVSSTVHNLELDEDGLNTYLLKMKKDSVLEVLSRVFDNNIYANQAYSDEWISTNYQIDYSSVIEQKSSVFDSAIGFACARRALQLFITTNRSNQDERIFGIAYNRVKGELEGFFTQEGQLIAIGLNQQYEAAIVRAIEILFPVHKKTLRTLTARKLW